MKHVVSDPETASPETRTIEKAVNAYDTGITIVVMIIILFVLATLRMFSLQLPMLSVNVLIRSYISVDLNGPYQDFGIEQKMELNVWMSVGH